MDRIFRKSVAVFLLLGFFILMAAMFTGCKSVKKAREKKKESVSLIQKNDVQLDEEIKTDLEVIRIDKSKTFSFESLDPEKPSQVIHGEDTLNFKNAKINVNLKDETNTSKDKSTQNRKENDQSQLEVDKKSKGKKLDLEKKGTSPALIWGSLLLLLLILIGWYLDKRFGWVSKIMSHF